MCGVDVMSLVFDTSTGIIRNPRAIFLALGTGALIASYTLVAYVPFGLVSALEPPVPYLSDTERLY